MTAHLLHAGITEPQKIEHYTLRSEIDNDILKIYYQRRKGQIFQKSVKLKFPRRSKRVPPDSGSIGYSDISEIDANLVHILAELDDLTGIKSEKRDKKAKLLSDIEHLERVMNNKIEEIKAEVARL